MKISHRFRLGRTQYELDFVDIDTDRDLPLFLDPHFLGSRFDRFSMDATRTLQSFFETFIALMRAGKLVEARALFEHLREPNETCLGLSRGRPRGNGIGSRQAELIFQSIRKSRAIQTGLIEHVEDVLLFVDNIGKDKVSDMTTNIIRKHLADYTVQQCKLWDIPLTPKVQIGSHWEPGQRDWVNAHGDGLIVDDRRILLVPKGVVSYATIYTAGQYHQHFVLTYLRNEHLRLGSALVQRRKLKSGETREYLTKTMVRKNEAPLEKDYLAKFTHGHLDVFADFRERQRKKTGSLGNHEFDPRTDLNDVIDHLAVSLREIQPGNDGARLYHRTAAAILELIFYPRLIYPQVEQEVDQGRKRIDLVFDNAAKDGFFHRLSTQHRIASPYIIVECKNYSRDVANPEVDQLLGRFNVNRGTFGLLVCRRADDPALLLNRCRDLHMGQRGAIVPLYDDDLLAMLEEVRLDRETAGERLLADRFRQLAM